MNSKKLAIFAILGLLLLGAAGFGLYTKKMNAEGFRGVGLSVKGVEKETVEDWMKTFDTVFQRDEVLQDIVAKSDYAAKLEISDSEAVGNLRGAVDVNFSKARNTIQIGVIGKKKHYSELDEISKHLFSVSIPLVAQLKPAFAVHYKSILQPSQ